MISTVGRPPLGLSVLALVGVPGLAPPAGPRMSEPERLTAADQDAFEAACHLAFHEVAHPDDIAM